MSLDRKSFSTIVIQVSLFESHVKPRPLSSPGAGAVVSPNDVPAESVYPGRGQ